jgi:hypothetical protein
MRDSAYLEMATQSVLQKTKFAAQMMVSQEVLETIAIEGFADPFADGFVMQLRLNVLGDRILRRDQEATVQFPANPWQHLKDRFAPGWFLRRWPVRYAATTVRMHVDVDAHYPQAQVPMGRTLGPVVFHETGQMTATFGPSVRSMLTDLTYAELRAGDRQGGPQ